MHEEAHEDDIHDLFSDFGTIKNLSLNLERRSGFVKGYALIEYHEKSEAQKAIDEMNSKEFRDKIMSVDWAFVDGPLNNDYTNFNVASTSYVTPGHAVDNDKRSNNRGGDRQVTIVRRRSDLGRRRRSPSPQKSRKRDRQQK